MLDRSNLKSRENNSKKRLTLKIKKKMLRNCSNINYSHMILMETSFFSKKIEILRKYQRI